jgi:hypothetical protein
MSARKPSIKNDLRLLDPKKSRIRCDAFGRLHLEVGFEERYGPVRAVRSLPLSRPTAFISIQDDEGEEIGLFEELAELDGESRHAVEEELELYYLKALVRAITKVEAKHGIISWDVETSLGTRRIHIRDRQQIRPLPNGRTILTDIHGAKYEIPPLDSLDETSRRLLALEL